MQWLDPEDPLVRSAVVSGNWGSEVVSSDYDFTVDPALQIACDLLTSLTGGLIHPAGIADEEFRALPRLHRLTPSLRPVREILSATRLKRDGTEAVMDTSSWGVVGQSVFFSRRGHMTFGTWYGGYYGISNAPGFRYIPDQEERIRLSYRFGTTVTAAAKRAVIQLAHELWLEAHPELGECQLPQRTSSVNREGIAYTIFDPQEYLSQGRTGLPSVDLWISSVNPVRAYRPAGVYTPDAPPGVNVRVASIRPLFPSDAP